MPIDYTVEARIAYLSWLANEDSAEEAWVRVLRDYADGEHPTYLTDRQEEFIGLKAKDASHLYAHNLCGLVIANVVERMHVNGFQPVDSNDAAGQALAEIAVAWWDANRMDANQDDLHEYACRDAEGYIIVEWDDADMLPRWTINQKFDGTQGVKLYRDPSTNEVLFAAKRWQEYDPFSIGATGGRTRCTVYFDNRVERWISTKDGKPRRVQVRGVEFVDTIWEEYRGPNGTDPWPIWWTEDGTPNSEPLGIAVIGFENPGGSEISQMISLQDALNKADLDLLAAEDMAGFRILWAAGLNAVIDTDDNEKDMTIASGKLVRFQDPNSRLDAIEPVDMPKMIAGSHYWIESIAGVTRTPQYLLRAMGADQPSGESLKEQEVGLEAKCKRKQRVWGNSYEDVMLLSAKLHNRYRPGESVELARLQTQWASVEVRNESEDLDSAEKAQNVGVAQEIIWERFLGMDAEQVQRNKELKAEEQAATQSPVERFLGGLENRG